MYTTVQLPFLLSVVALAVASPYYLPQQRQLYYPVVPQYHAPLAPQPYRQFYYPSAASNYLAAPVPALRYPAPLLPPAKQVVYYPGMPYPMVLAGDESSGGWTSWFNNVFNSFYGGPEAEEAAAPAAAESPANSPAPAPVQEGQKVEQAQSNAEPTKEGEKESVNEEKPAEETQVKGLPQSYVMAGQPQFFGDFRFRPQQLVNPINPAVALPTAHNGAISSYLLLRNIPGVRFAAPVPQVPQAADVDATSEQKPGEAALGYQKLLQETLADRQQKDFDDSSVTVEAENIQKDSAPVEEKPTSEAEASDDKESEDEETGTSE